MNVFNFQRLSGKNNSWNCPRDWLISSHGDRDTWDYLFNKPGYGRGGGYPKAGAICHLSAHTGMHAKKVVIVSNGRR